MQYDASDVHQAINYTLTTHSEIDSSKIALVGHGYGATLAMQISLMQKENSKNVAILANPIADIGAMSSSLDTPEWPYHVMGVNYTTASVPTDILTEAWELSPLSKVHHMEATAALIFIGIEDERVLPEAQGIALYKAMRSSDITTSLYHYPKEGHTWKSIETIHHFLGKSARWMLEHWNFYADECSLDPPSTSTTEHSNGGHEDPDNGSGSSTNKPGSTTKKPTTSGAMDHDYFKATFVLVSMQLFTLSLWVQMK